MTSIEQSVFIVPNYRNESELKSTPSVDDVLDALPILSYGIDRDTNNENDINCKHKKKRNG